MPDLSLGDLVAAHLQLTKTVADFTPATLADLTLAAQTVSGRYAVTGALDEAGLPVSSPLDWVVRIDVDGPEPQQCLSVGVTFPGGFFGHYIFRVEALGGKDGLAGFAGPLFWHPAFTDPLGVDECVLNLALGPLGEATGGLLTLGSKGTALHTLKLKRKDRFFRDLHVEIDDLLVPKPKVHAPVLTSFDPRSYPVFAPDLPMGDQTISGVFARAGVKAKVVLNHATADVDGLGDDGLWDEAELHNLMQEYWNANPGQSAWSTWQGLVGKSVFGKDMLGLMFDVHDTLQRQGSALFLTSLLNAPPFVLPINHDNDEAGIARGTFFNMIHEIGHCFNLDHSFEKSTKIDWMELATDKNARSFMNYPNQVQGGQAAFFADFGYRFSDDELLFMRHAPDAFVRMGGDAWGLNHAARPGGVSIRPLTGRWQARFMEPVWLEVALPPGAGERASRGGAGLLDNSDLVVLVRRHGGHWRRWRPMFRWCTGGHATAAPAAARWTVPLSLSATGWLVDEPGDYDVQVACQTNRGLAWSAVQRLSVQPPASRQETRLAPDWFVPEMARLLAFGGCPALANSEAVARRVAALGHAHPAAIHAALALATPRAAGWRQVSRMEGRPPHIARSLANGDGRSLAAERRMLAAAGIAPERLARSPEAAVPGHSHGARLARMAARAG